MQVLKRDGSSEPLDIEKIHKATFFATQGLDVSQSEVETAAHIMLFDGIRTSDIQKALIQAAAGLISVEQQDYTYVAARLLLQCVYKDVTGGSVEYPSLRSYIEAGVKAERLDPRLLDFDLEELNDHIQPKRDLQFNYLGLQTVVDRYLIREVPLAGEAESRIIEMPQHFFMRVAMGLALNESESMKNHWAAQFYHTLSSFEFMSSTPTLFNSGTLHPQMSSCYGNTVDDAIWEPGGQLGHGIFASITECALLSKFAGGIGTDWTPVRSAGDVIKGTNGKSSGVVPYLKIFNDTAVAVNQCFAPDTLVRVPDGVKRIADIQIGDLVLGQRGEYREVYDVMSYEQKDSMVSVKVKHSLEPLLVTSGHPIFAIKGIPVEQSLERTLKQIDSGKFVPEWVEAGKLEKGDYVAQVVPTEVIPVDGFTVDDARLYGIMLGDGHCHLKALKDFKNDDVVAKEWGVTGSSAEEETLVFVADYLTKRGISYNYSTVGSGATQIKWSYGGKQQERDAAGKFVSGVNCLPFDHDDLYDQDGNKRINRRFAHLPLEQALGLVQGLIESDGCVSRGKEVTFTNTSIALVEGLRYQMLRLSVPTAGNKKVRSNEHLGYDSITTSWDVRIPAVFELAQALGIPAVTKFNWFRLGNMIFTRVVSVENIESAPVVHDLKVDGDHTYSTTATLVHNGGKRNGAFAAYLEPWHPDVLDFIDLKKNAGDERRRTHDIFPALWIPDLFFKRVQSGDMWSFFSPKDAPTLHELYGDSFEAHYEYLEREQPQLIRSQMPAKDLWRKILNSLFETGHPWITFKDECNRRNPQDHVGVIHNSNLCCMTGDQRVVTDAGILTVKELYDSGRKNKVVGLTEYSNASEMLLPRPNAPIVEIQTAEGYSHKVTPDHRVWVKDKGWVEAQDLIVGDKLLTQQIEGMFGTINEPKLGLIAGLAAGDGTFTDSSVCVDLWGDKTKKFVPVIERVVMELIAHEPLQAPNETWTPKFIESNQQDKARLCSAPLARVLARHGFTKNTKLAVPDFVWKGDRATVTGYLRGLYLTDGNVQVGKDATCMALASVSKEFLKEIQILWANFGVKSSLNKVHDGGKRDFGDSYGEYECQPCWRLLITSVQGCKIAERVTMLGKFRTGDSANTFVNNLKKKGYTQKLYATFAGLTEIPNEDAYCLTVDSESHAWTVNGLITHNTEITLNNDQDETFVCNLGSVNLSKISNEEGFQKFLARVVPTAVRMLDNVIDINFYPTEKSRTSNLRHRPIGLGVMGYTDWLVRNGTDWESEQHLFEADMLFEDLSFHAIKASMMLAQERGAYPTFEGSKWHRGILPIDTARQNNLFENCQDWDWLREQIQTHGIRNSNLMAIAPTATISNIVGTTPCIEPVYARTTEKQNLSGTFTLVDPALRHNKPWLCKEAFEIDQTWIIKAAAVHQKWIDQSQSTNLFIDPTKINGKKLSDLYLLAWELGLKTTYYLKTKSAKLKTSEAPVKEAKPLPEPEVVGAFCTGGPECESCQ